MSCGHGSPMPSSSWQKWSPSQETQMPLLHSCLNTRHVFSLTPSLSHLPSLSAVLFSLPPSHFPFPFLDLSFYPTFSFSFSTLLLFSTPPSP